MHEKLNKGLFFGLIGNILFVVFGIVCFIFYKTYNSESIISKLLEVTAYAVEFMGFGLLMYSDYLLSVSLRLRRLLKVSYTAYIVLEALIMVLEINSVRFDSFYQPYSLALAIVHSVVSGAACFSFLQLDPDNPKFEGTIVASIALIFCGMLGAILGIRVYFSVLINALGFSLFFGMVNFLLSREEIEIDCYGDRARVAEYSSSTIFTKEEKVKAPLKEDSETVEEKTEE